MGETSTAAHLNAGNCTSPATAETLTMRMPQHVERSSVRSPVTANRRDGYHPLRTRSRSMDSNGMPFAKRYWMRCRERRTYAESRDTSDRAGDCDNGYGAVVSVGAIRPELRCSHRYKGVDEFRKYRSGQECDRYAIVHQIKNWDVPGRGAALRLRWSTTSTISVFARRQLLGQTPEGGPAGIFNGLYDREYLSSGPGRQWYVVQRSSRRPRPGDDRRQDSTSAWTVIDAPLDGRQLIFDSS